MRRVCRFRRQKSDGESPSEAVKASNAEATLILKTPMKIGTSGRTVKEDITLPENGRQKG
jgi:hypothetical protein